MTGLVDQPAMMFLLLIGGHALGDFGLQTLYMANGKNRHGAEANQEWFFILFAHSAIHGAIVGLVTGYAIFGFAEVALHMLIDDTKCASKLSFKADQALHYGCKLLWGIAAIALAAYGF